MEYLDEEIGPDPEILRLGRYRPHGSRLISKQTPKESDIINTRIAVWIWIIVLIVLILVLSFLNQKILNSPLGFLGIGISLAAVIGIVMWYLQSNTRGAFGFMIVLLLFLFLWWALVELFEFDHIPDVLAVVGIIISIAAYAYHPCWYIIITIVAFLVLLYISNFGLNQCDDVLEL